jgi:DNA (cytosine-5)-methyltransferase 1
VKNNLNLDFKNSKNQSSSLIFRSSKSNLKYIDITSYNPAFNIEKNGVISLFSGAGGLDIGLEHAGFDTKVCVEINQHCRETIKTNRPEWNVMEEFENPGDIRSATTDMILKAGGLRKKEAALVVGGAPCQPFSNIGKKLGAECPKNGDLFQEYVRVVREALPKSFIFENVSGITQKKHSAVIDYMKESFTELGYSVSYSIINSADYGVPQKRERFFIIGIKGDTEPAFPMPTHFKDHDSYERFFQELEIKPLYDFKKWVSIGETFKKIPKNYRNRTDFAEMNISQVVQNRMKHIGPNENFKVLPASMRPDCWNSGKHQGQDTFGRLDINDVAVTIRTAAYNPSKGKYIHPLEHRGLNTIELAALQSFPYEWKFKSKGREKITLASGGMQIGNAVPPLLAEALGKSLMTQFI